MAKRDGVTFCDKCGQSIAQNETHVVRGELMLCMRCGVPPAEGKAADSDAPPTSVAPILLEEEPVESSSLPLAIPVDEPHMKDWPSTGQPHSQPSPPLQPMPMRGNVAKTYKERCGLRSFIFQCVLLGWTAFMFLVGVGMLLAVSPSREELELSKQGDSWARAGVLASSFWGLFCPAAVWALVAFPLGVAAISTLESRRKKNE